MNKALNFFKTILIIGFFISLPIVVDSLLPKNRFNKEVVDVFRGTEEGYNSTAPVGFKFGNSLTHFKVKLANEDKYFPISRSDFEQFSNGDSVQISKSQIFKKYSYIVNRETGFSTNPVTGLYSNFFSVVLSLFIGSSSGFAFRRNDEAVIFLGILMFLLIPITLYLSLA